MSAAKEDRMTPSEQNAYRSVEEVRAAFYPRSVFMLKLASDEILELPADFFQASRT